MPQLQKSKGKGWWNESERHSRARKYGKAGGTYRTQSDISLQDNSEYKKVTDKSFEQWLEERGGIQGFIKDYDVDVEEYVYYFEERYPNVPKDDIRKMAIKQIRDEAEENYEDWIWKYRGFGFPLTLYREIGLTDGVDFKETGEYWSDKKEKAESHWAERVPGIKTRFVILKTEVDKEDIDWENTLWANMSPVIGVEEQEIRLKKDRKIIIKEVINSETDKIIKRNIKAKT